MIDMEALSNVPQVQFRSPLTSMRSTLAFCNAIKSDGDFEVFAAGLVPVTKYPEEKRYVGQSFHCIDSARICEIKCNSTQMRYRTKASKPIASFDDVSEIDLQDAADVYDEGCSMLSANVKDESDLSPDISPGDEKLERDHDNEIQKNILAARKDGRLPLDVKISILGSSTFYTEEELEQMAVDSHLRRHDQIASQILVVF